MKSTANLVRFNSFTKHEAEINQLRFKKMLAEKSGKSFLAKELALKITQKETEQIKKGMTTNGIQLYAPDGFVKGSLLEVITPDGKIPAPDGTYNLDNGDIIEVGENGIILSVSNPVKQIAAGIEQLKKSSAKSMTDHIQRTATEKNSRA